jgi:hypothetical protein
MDAPGSLTMSAAALSEAEIGGPWAPLNHGYVYHDQIRGADGAGTYTLLSSSHHHRQSLSLNPFPGISVLQFYTSRYSSSGSESE